MNDLIPRLRALSIRCHQPYPTPSGNAALGNGFEEAILALERAQERNDKLHQWAIKSDKHNDELQERIEQLEAENSLLATAVYDLLGNPSATRVIEISKYLAAIKDTTP